MDLKLLQRCRTKRLTFPFFTIEKRLFAYRKGKCPYAKSIKPSITAKSAAEIEHGDCAVAAGLAAERPS